jgi:uncharacterized protein
MKAGFLTSSAPRVRHMLCSMLVSGVIGVSVSAGIAAENLGPAPTDQPSFPCVSPNAVEAAICADPALAARDRTMAPLYAASRNGALGSASSPQQGAQKQWLKSRTDCLKEDLRKCLTDMYDSRLNELAVAALFESKNVALAELARQDPKVAPLYEAIYFYATRDTQALRIKTVEPLIAPIFKALSDMPTSLFENVPNARTVAASDTAFALFLDVASVSDYRLTLPCAALVRRPGLIHALNSQYGGAIDGQLINTDCASTLPSLPMVERLVEAATSVQEECRGSVRFSLGRDYGKTLVAIRLHRSDVWKARDMGDGTQDPVGQFRLRHRARIVSATAELTQYYAKYFNLSKQVARADAVSAIKAIVAGAFNFCENG